MADRPLPFQIYIGYDGREAVASDVAAHSITKRATVPISIKHLKHRELAEQGKFYRPWVTMGPERETYDMIDGKKFSTEFSHTRFLIPDLMDYQGWALFMDADMIFLTDIKKLIALLDDSKAVMCVKHNHMPADGLKMDGREQLRYHRKNWSSFVLWNCGHPANKKITKEQVNFMHGKDLHAFSWLDDTLIGSIPHSYNYISGVSPKLPPERGGRPDVIHYTDGGPWFPNCQNVPYAEWWVEEYECWQRNGEGNKYTDIPSTRYER